MATRGVPSDWSSSGMDGLDHGYRQRIAAHYQASATAKSRLKYCMFLHYMMALLMLAKLVPFILDKFNFFILAIEELEVPEPLGWEWVWLFGIFSSFFCLNGIKKNNYTSIKNYICSIIIFGYLPLIYGAVYWFPEAYMFIFHKGDGFRDGWYDIQLWKGYPYGLLWFAFIIPGFQLHSFTMYFSIALLRAWKPRSLRNKDD
ncbi:hypothetical protein ABEB36_010636 [Hypothenemus hampei]|uniref:Protein jagunal n=1 Tax=Hypothenemus hampei TaxID=57062 RepID=A0ABD1ECK5_HYPHA